MIYITSDIVNTDAKELISAFKETHFTSMSKQDLEKRSKKGDCNASHVLYNMVPKSEKHIYEKRMFFQSKAMYDRQKNNVFSVCMPLDKVNAKEYRKYLKSCVRRGALYNLLWPSKKRKLNSNRENETFCYMGFCISKLIAIKFGNKGKDLQ